MFRCKLLSVLIHKIKKKKFMSEKRNVMQYLLETKSKSRNVCVQAERM